jgi:hypothetical protein
MLAECAKKQSSSPFEEGVQPAYLSNFLAIFALGRRLMFREEQNGRTEFPKNSRGGSLESES